MPEAGSAGAGREVPDRLAQPDPDATVANDRTLAMAGPAHAAQAAGPPPGGESAYAGSYAVRGLIGQGGIGRVYLGFDRSIGREVAIKELLDAPDGAAAGGASPDPVRARFLREARITGQLEHPGVVPVHEISARPDGAPFYVMRYVHGRTLEDALGECADADAEAAFKRRMQLLGSLIQTCEATAYAHARGIIHRDLKPANVVLGAFGETVILDWGLARRIEEDDGPAPGTRTDSPAAETGELTSVGELLGTPNYMAPEQVDPAFGPVGKPSDVYALGTILFRLLTGTLPYEGSGRSVLRALAGRAPSPSPKRHRRGIPPELAAICEKAMCKDPGGRFPDAAAMAAELRAFRDGRLVSIYAYTRGELLRRFVSRNRVAVIAAAGVFLSALVGGALALRYALEAERARAQAELALEEVTELGELAQAHARKGTAALDAHLQALQAELEAAARGAGGDPEAALRAAHARLASRTPGLAGLFWVDPSGSVRAAQPPDLAPPTGAGAEARPATGWIDPAEGRSVSGAFGDGPRASWVGIQVPLAVDGRHAGVFAALLRADRVIAAAIPPPLPVRGRRPDVWAMQRDGLVLYDEDPEYVGTDLFRDRVNTVLPGVVEFGRRMQAEDAGVSHYAYFSADGLGREHYVAAWHTLTFPSGVQWQVVVDYPYVVVRQ